MKIGMIIVAAFAALWASIAQAEMRGYDRQVLNDLQAAGRTIVLEVTSYR
jgi:hypothetical protein